MAACEKPTSKRDSWRIEKDLRTRLVFGSEVFMFYASLKTSRHWWGHTLLQNRGPAVSFGLMMISLLEETRRMSVSIDDSALPLCIDWRDVVYVCIE